jgi:hypothetical protein
MLERTCREYANSSLFNHSVFAASDAAHVGAIDNLLEKLAVLHMAGGYTRPLPDVSAHPEPSLSLKHPIHPM